MPRLTRFAAVSLVVGAVAAVAACGSSSTAPTAVPDISGTWTVGASVSNAGLQVTCSLQGTATVQQSGSNFTGNFTGSTTTCTGPGGTVAGNADGPITGGQIVGSTVSYNDGQGCAYTGTVTGTPANRIQGSATCQLAVAGQTYTFTGTWTAGR